ncbi:predicted protein, partial [Nematostella vectensis]
EPISGDTVVGKNFTFTCRVEGIPKPDIKWKYNGGPLNLAHSTINNTLVVFNVQNTDRYEGSYECEASSRAGNASSSASLTVYALLFFLSVKPELELLPKSQTVLVNRTVVFTCSASGIPTPQLTWSFSGGNLPNYDIDGNKLSIVNVQNNASYEGNYTCTADSRAGRTSFTAMLTVHALPKITKLLNKTLVAERGSNVQLSCQASGDPTPKYKWTYNGVPISPRKNVQLEDDNRLLILKKVSPVSNGVYRCIAYNTEGNDTTETNLIVHVPMPPRNVNASAVSSTSIRVTWSVPQRTNGKLTWYKVYY